VPILPCFHRTEIGIKSTSHRPCSKSVPSSCTLCAPPHLPCDPSTAFLSHVSGPLLKTIRGQTQDRCYRLIHTESWLKLTQGFKNLTSLDSHRLEAKSYLTVRKLRVLVKLEICYTHNTCQHKRNSGTILKHQQHNIHVCTERHGGKADFEWRIFRMVANMYASLCTFISRAKARQPGAQNLSSKLLSTKIR
jgi:hypothetical protein